MSRPYALLRAGLPYLKTLGMRRWTDYPIDLVIDKEGILYILCRASGLSGIIRLTWEDEHLGEIGSTGENDGQFVWPCNILLDTSGHLVISDEKLHRITTLTTDGQFVSKWGDYGHSEGQLNHPSGIAFDPDQNLYVADTLNHRIQRFTRDGKFLGTFGRYGTLPGEFNMPWGLSVDELGDVYVADWHNDRIQKFTEDGELILTFGCSGSNQGEFIRPAGVEVDSDGDIYVSDSGNDRIQVFNPTGGYLETIIGDATLGRAGRDYLLNNAKPLRLREMTSVEQQKRLRDPKTVRVDQNGRIFITDYGSHRLQVYQKDAIPLTKEQILPPLRSPTLDLT